MLGLGIAWASMTGVPYIMVTSMIQRERSGVYMGIVNMMIVVPMLFEAITFGWTFDNLLGSSAPNAMILAGVLLGFGGLAMLWVDDPDDVDERGQVLLDVAGDNPTTRIAVGNRGFGAAEG